jgi:hypothetical protein
MGMSPTLGLAGLAVAALPMPANAVPKKVRLRIREISTLFYPRTASAACANRQALTEAAIPAPMSQI